MQVEHPPNRVLHRRDFDEEILGFAQHDPLHHQQPLLKLEAPLPQWPDSFSPTFENSGIFGPDSIFLGHSRHLYLQPHSPQPIRYDDDASSSSNNSNGNANSGSNNTNATAAATASSTTYSTDNTHGSTASPPAEWLGPAHLDSPPDMTMSQTESRSASLASIGTAHGHSPYLFHSFSMGYLPFDDDGGMSHQHQHQHRCQQQLLETADSETSGRFVDADAANSPEFMPPSSPTTMADGSAYNAHYPCIDAAAAAAAAAATAAYSLPFANHAVYTTELDDFGPHHALYHVSPSTIHADAAAAASHDAHCSQPSTLFPSPAVTHAGPAVLPSSPDPCCRRRSNTTADDGGDDDQVQTPELPQRDDADDDDSDYKPKRTAAAKKKASRPRNKVTKRVPARQQQQQQQQQRPSLKQQQAQHQRKTQQKRQPKHDRKLAMAALGSPDADAAATGRRAELEPDRRPFTCPGRPYGCPTTFATKNEWKRHVISQHLCFGFWRCDLCPDHLQYPNDFNRKDLFTQHLRRMHSPAAAAKLVSPAASKGNFRHRGTGGSGKVRQKPVPRDDAFEKQLDAIRRRCWVQARQPPDRLICTFCTLSFDGDMCYEEYLEHVGRHLAIAADRHDIDLDRCHAMHADLFAKDDLLRHWLVSNGLLQESERTGLELVSRVAGAQQQPHHYSAASQVMSDELPDAEGDSDN